MNEQSSSPLADMCSCSNCGWKGKTSDCETEMESDGWEQPEYQIHLCPVCEDGGCVDDYWFSEESIETDEEMKARIISVLPKPWREGDMGPRPAGAPIPMTEGE